MPRVGQRGSSPKDMTGQAFGFLTVECLHSTERRTSQWRCVCRCGNRKVADRSHLVKGSVRSCGCWRKTLLFADKQEHIGKRYGNLVVLNVGTLEESSWWLCRCDCGNEKRIKQCNVVTGNSTTCGCSWRAKGKDHHRWKANLTAEDRRRRNSSETREWAKTIYKRDDYRCQISLRRGGELVAHHLNAWASFPDQRFNTDNGMTLYKPIHVLFHSLYGRGQNTRAQFDEFVKRCRAEEFSRSQLGLD